MDVAARTALIEERTDELLVMIGRCAQLTDADRNVLLAATAARLTVDPLAAAVVAGPLFGLLFTSLVELAKASGRSVDEVVADYRRESTAAMESARRLLSGGAAAT